MICQKNSSDFFFIFFEQILEAEATAKGALTYVTGAGNEGNDEDAEENKKQPMSLTSAIIPK